MQKREKTYRAKENKNFSLACFKFFSRCCIFFERFEEIFQTAYIVLGPFETSSSQEHSQAQFQGSLQPFQDSNSASSSLTLAALTALDKYREKPAQEK